MFAICSTTDLVKRWDSNTDKFVGNLKFITVEIVPWKWIWRRFTYFMVLFFLKLFSGFTAASTEHFSFKSFLGCFQKRICLGSHSWLNWLKGGWINIWKTSCKRCSSYNCGVYIFVWLHHLMLCWAISQHIWAIVPLIPNVMESRLESDWH